MLKNQHEKYLMIDNLLFLLVMVQFLFFMRF